MAHVIASPLFTFLSHKQNHTKEWGQQRVFYPKEKVQMIKKHMKRYSTSHNRENTNWNKILGFYSLHRPERRKRFLLTKADKDWKRAFSKSMGVQSDTVICYLYQILNHIISGLEIALLSICPTESLHDYAKM